MRQALSHRRQPPLAVCHCSQWTFLCRRHLYDRRSLLVKRLGVSVWRQAQQEHRACTPWRGQPTQSTFMLHKNIHPNMHCPCMHSFTCIFAHHLDLHTQVQCTDLQHEFQLSHAPIQEQHFCFSSLLTHFFLFIWSCFSVVRLCKGHLNSTFILPWVKHFQRSAAQDLLVQHRHQQPLVKTPRISRKIHPSDD